MAARLQTLRPRLKVQEARHKTVTAGSWRAGKTTAAARGYGADWQRVRAKHLATHPHCVYCLRDLGMSHLSPVDVVLQCAERGVAEPIGTIGDHITPHQGDDRLRLDPANVQTRTPISRTCSSTRPSALAADC